jgi:NAD(P)-dependent dehydrogenase (short-subunit alcohol dehydrogenase family)
MSMQSLPSAYSALVLGASGTIGSAIAAALRHDPQCGTVIEAARGGKLVFDLTDQDSVAELASRLQSAAPFHLIVDATGALTIDGCGPEKRLQDLDIGRLQQSFLQNATGPIILFRHLLPLMPSSGRAIYAKLSARVGSIGDNRKGGWYGYRAGKAALNMLFHTAAIEAGRGRRDLVIALLQPGTVPSRLSGPYIAGAQSISPELSAQGMLQAIDALPPASGAHFIDWKGNPIAW